MISLLIIEDDPLFGPLVERMASALGCETTLCTSAESALLMCKGGGFDAVVADVVLPGKSGLDFVTEAKPNHVVLMSGQIASAVGAHLLIGTIFLSKPFSIHELRVALQRAGLTI